MSVFESTNVNCPACGAATPFEAVQSVNADRRPDLRESILDESFQQQPCAACGESFRLAPDLNYLDIGRGQWFAAHPLSDISRWQEIENNDRAAFAKAFGESAPPPAKALGAELKPRITFGWAGLREKIVAGEVGIDDVELELMKMVIIRNLESSPLRDDSELRLLGVQDGDLLLGWVETISGRIIESMQVPMELYFEVEADEDLDELRAQVSTGLFVDINRLLVPGGPELEPAAVPAEAGDIDAEDRSEEEG